MTGISIQVSEENGFTILTISGPINSYTFTELQEKINKYAGKVNLAIHLGGVTTMTSAGIGVILAAIEDTEAAGKKIFIIAPSEIARLAMESTGFMDSFPILNSIKELQ
ncbi:MAG TPA: STAS domain-containing protein [Spirochaetia bacterium]|nr:STAS domain-containing protein [Spirochaetales bacterium]HPD79637.1 STAS domain-containing protein [Spirochaetales bacterium]HQG39844.1 STAS domain-containing protein [Spirochaetales bacterium]HRS64661.1 STAS domain-containing protein [Spirochaetia bacterium]HRV27386.1 STAS domain-containing protein [Spirochaetia bacterium]